MYLIWPGPAFWNIPNAWRRRHTTIGITSCREVFIFLIARWDVTRTGTLVKPQELWVKYLFCWVYKNMFREKFSFWKIFGGLHTGGAAVGTDRSLPLKRNRILTSEFDKLVCWTESVTAQFVVLIFKTVHHCCVFEQSKLWEIQLKHKILLCSIYICSPTRYTNCFNE